MTQNEQPEIPLDLIKQGVNNMGIARLLGMRIEALEDGIGRVSIQVNERLMHPQQIVHGGVIFTLADTAMSMALISVIPPGTRFSTIEAKINFLAPVRAGGLLAGASIMQQGRSIPILEAPVFNSYHSAPPACARILG